MARYKLRKATNQDNEAINQLYNRITGRQRNLKEYNWEWLENPAGESERWVICEGSTGEIVGHHGLIPIRFNHRETTLLAGKTENTMVAPEHRNKFVYLSYEKRMLEKPSRSSISSLRRREGVLLEGFGMVLATKARSLDDLCSVRQPSLCPQQACRKESIKRSAVFVLPVAVAGGGSIWGSQNSTRAGCDRNPHDRGTI